MGKFFPGMITNTGAGLVLINAIQGLISGSTSPKEALFQAGIGIIGLGLRRAIGNLNI